MENSNPSAQDHHREHDRRADVWAVLIIFTCLVLGAVHFISG